MHVYFHLSCTSISTIMTWMNKQSVTCVSRKVKKKKKKGKNESEKRTRNEAEPREALAFASAKGVIADVRLRFLGVR